MPRKQPSEEKTSSSSISTAERIIALVFAGVVLATFVVLVLNPRLMDSGTLAIVRFLASIFAGIAGYLFSGNLNLEATIPLTKAQIRAAGSFAAFVLVLLLFFYAVPSENTSSPKAPNILSFEAENPSILYGQPSTLRWLTSNSSSVQITSSQGALLSSEATRGSHIFFPKSSETYVLTAKNESGRSVQQTLKVDVIIPCQESAVARTNLRSKPGAFTMEEIKEMIERRGFRENDWNPNGNFPNSYEVYGKVVADCAAGLMWQRSGSEQEIYNWETAPNYIKQINAESYAQFRDWRLPTIEELASLLEPRKNSKGLFIDEVFDEKDNFWSSDDWIITDPRVNPVAWSANFDYGGIFHGGAKVNRFFVRAVRSL